MAIEEMKQKLHEWLTATNNSEMLESILIQVQNEDLVNEGLSREDYEELDSLAKEPVEKETVSYDDLKASLSRWFTS